MKYRTILADAGLLWLRALMGLGIAAHGLQKLLNGELIDGMIQFTTKAGFPLPVLFAIAAVFSEFLGGILVALGFATRFSAFLIAATMGVAAFVAHAKDPFKVKEMALAYLVMAVAVVLLGGGRWSLDRLIFKKESGGNPADGRR